MAYKTLYAPNGSVIDTMQSLSQKTAYFNSLKPIRGSGLREIAADYSAPIMGSSPGGFGFTFGDSWRRTQRGTMEFQLPTTWVDSMNMAFRFAFENVFIAKALRIKTDFTCKGLRNKTPNKYANRYFDSVIKMLELSKLYRLAVWMYWTIGIVPILMSPVTEPLSYIELLDPRMVRTFTAFGKTIMYVVPDQRMLDAVKDPKGKSNPMNKDYYEMMPKSWVDQIRKKLQTTTNYRPIINGNVSSEVLIKLDPGSYVVIQNRDCKFSRYQGGLDGAPLQPYFAAAEEYRMLMGGDFASAFVSKNLIALVSVGDPKSEGDNYQRPDNQVLANLASAFSNPNEAQWSFVDPTTQIRYSTPDPNTFSAAKYQECKEQLKNLLPSPFWFNEGQGSYSGATVEIKALREEVEACNDRFDRDFWTPIYERAAGQAPKLIADKNILPPEHDKNSLIDDATRLAIANGIYGNGGLSNRTILEEFGYDYDVERQRKLDELEDVKQHIWMPWFEQKQGITADIVYGIGDSAPDESSDSDAKDNGHPSQPGSQPQVEKAQGSRTPRKGK